MKAYIQTNKNGDYYNVNAFIAAEGFETLGFEVIKYHEVEEVKHKDKEAIFVGGISNIKKRLKYLGIDKQNQEDYPKELQAFFNRKIWKSTLKTIIKNEAYGIFIKPTETKFFQGKVIREFRDFIGLNYDEEVEIWCSEVVEILTEWRCFIRYGKLLDVRYYKGYWNNKLDINLVNTAIEQYTNQPAAYSLDFGIGKDGKYYLIEVNDGYSMGSYGMLPVPYAKFLSAR